jgi:hypothetical protein
MSETGSSEELKELPRVGTADADVTSIKVTQTRKGELVLVPQPSDNPEDPLVRSQMSKNHSLFSYNYNRLWRFRPGTWQAII